MSKAYDGFWHDLAHGTRISGNFGESPRTDKTLIINTNFENQNGVKGLRLASQAYDEGSISFTRSKLSLFLRFRFFIDLGQHLEHDSLRIERGGEAAIAGDLETWRRSSCGRLSAAIMPRLRMLRLRRSRPGRFQIYPPSNSR